MFLVTFVSAILTINDHDTFCPKYTSISYEDESYECAICTKEAVIGSLVHNLSESLGCYYDSVALGDELVSAAVAVCAAFEITRITQFH